MQQSAMAFLQMLIGEWIAEDEAGVSGGFTFLPDLQNTIYIRRNHASYAATNETSAYRHDDLMVVYLDPQTHDVRAWYADNEGHIINYVVKPVQDEQTIELLSSIIPATPRYRLRYRALTPDLLQLSFAIAPAEQPDIFATYIESQVRRALPETGAMALTE
jgi:hypothetical protein